MKYLKFLISLSLVASIHTFAQESEVPPPSLEDVIDAESQAAIDSKNRQESIDQLDEEFIVLKSDIQFLSQELDITNAYNNQLRKLIQSQEEEIISINEQIVQLDQTSRDVTPFMIEMVNALEQLIEIDTPFLYEERTQRVTELAALLDRSDISISEKFRRIFEAYQIENEFGRTIEAYKDEISIENETYNVDVFRLGRVGLYARTPDGSEAAIYNSKINPGDVIVVRYEGPVGGPGMREMLKPTSAIMGKDMGDKVAFITDGRFSGGSHGFVVGHITPEAAKGGLIGLLEDGDEITIDAIKGKIDAKLSKQEITERRKSWVNPKPYKERGVLSKYAKVVSSASLGAITD